MIFLAGPPTAGCQDRVSPAMETLATGDHYFFAENRFLFSYNADIEFLLHFSDHLDVAGHSKASPSLGGEGRI